MLYSVKPETLTNHEKSKSRFLCKIFQFFNDHYTGQTFICCPVCPKDYTFATSKSYKKWICTVFGEYKNSKIYGQRIKLDAGQT